MSSRDSSQPRLQALDDLGSLLPYLQRCSDLSYPVILESGRSETDPTANRARARVQRFDLVAAEPAELLSFDQLNPAVAAEKLNRACLRHLSLLRQKTEATPSAPTADSEGKFKDTRKDKPEQNSAAALPFVGGAIGLVSYSGAAASQLEQSTPTATDRELAEPLAPNEEPLASLKEPLATNAEPLATSREPSATDAEPLAIHSAPAAIVVGVYRWAILRLHEPATHAPSDHAIANTAKHSRTVLVADPSVDEEEWQALCQRFAKLTPRPPATFNLQSEWRCNVSAGDYAAQFAQVKEYIRAGDCYQVNLSREFRANYSGSALGAYERCRNVSAAPFSGLLQTPYWSLASLSPERFISIANGQVTTQPIKGSRARLKDPNADSQTIAELAQSPKDRAENLMIVDLMRNDLGRHCRPGSVEVTKLFEIQSFSNVHHLVSTITGQLEDSSLAGALRCFFQALPGGSITGAPKIRAMQIIDELETHQRSIYCGSLFYVNHLGQLDSNILIRSLLFKHPRQEADGKTGRKADTKTGAETDKETGAVKECGELLCCGGGGLVLDSEPQAEYDESYYKVSHLLDVLAR